MAWDKLHSKLATISAAADVDKIIPRMLLNAQPNISELVKTELLKINIKSTLRTFLV